MEPTTSGYAGNPRCIHQVGQSAGGGLLRQPLALRMVDDPGGSCGCRTEHGHSDPLVVYGLSVM
jgi:hypothetical protein